MRLARLASLVTATELATILAIAPALMFPTPGRLLVLCVVPIVWGCARFATGRFVPSTPMNAALFLLLASVGVSLYATFDIGYSLRKVSGLILGMLLFWAITRWLTTVDRLKTATLLFLLAGAGLAILGLLGTAWTGEKFSPIQAVAALLPAVIRGVPGAEEGFNKNAVAGCLVLFVPLQVALLATHSRRWLLSSLFRNAPGTWTAAVQPVLLFLTAGTLILTQSRGAWIGLTVATAGFFLWRGRRARVAGAVAAVAGTALSLTLGPTRLLDFAMRHAGPDVEGSTWMRIELWSRAISAIQDVPLSGMGMNGFRKVMPVLYPTVLGLDLDQPHAHNHLLQVALDLGIPGLVAYLAIWIVVVLLLAGVYRQSEDRVRRAMAGGFGTGLLAHFLFGMGDAIPLGSKVGVLFWITLAMVVGLHRVSRARPQG
jgi:putative inorganic carbon (HCO3(-)) transporter